MAQVGVLSSERLVPCLRESRHNFCDPTLVRPQKSGRFRRSLSH
jgi:hypothetical protein